MFRELRFQQLQQPSVSVHSWHVEASYIASERFIHDELARRCAHSAEQVLVFWRTYHRIYPTLLLWPSSTIKTVTGEKFSGVIFTELPEAPEARRAAIVAAANRCKAYGLLLTEQLDQAVRLIFESECGTRTWRFPIKNHGDIQVLGTPTLRDNVESIGIRWKAN
jgi:hypothetical protein